MPLYTYRALDAGGRQEKGSLNAASEKEALAVLRGRSIYPLQLRSTQPFSLSLKNWVRLGRNPRISNKELAGFTRQLATLLEATIPYDTALRMVQAESSNASLQAVLTDVRARVVEGAYLADALAAHPHFFPSMLQNMVRSGENSGKLVIILGRLASYYENMNRLRTKIASALVYPAFMLVFSAAVVTFMVTYIIPKISRLFSSFGGVLPLPTRILIATSHVVVNYWWLILILALGAGWGLVWFLRTEFGRGLKDRIELTLPIWGEFLRKLLMQRLTETLATMLHSGVELNHALTVSKEVMQNRVYLKAMENVIVDIQNKGMQLSAAMRRTGLFPEDICQMIAIGEETATLNPMLENVAARLSNEVTATMDSATALFEPVMILLMGAVVGFIVISILLPMLQLNQLVG
ncbi:MAG: type II secretion system F family protein [SAR324 cluster bacterium]|nr:type II secretion system F family protein [SAR324 cluster bacterium]